MRLFCSQRARRSHIPGDVHKIALIGPGADTLLRATGAPGDFDHQQPDDKSGSALHPLKYQDVPPSHLAALPSELARPCRLTPRFRPRRHKIAASRGEPTSERGRKGWIIPSYRPIHRELSLDNGVPRWRLHLDRCRHAPPGVNEKSAVRPGRRHAAIPHTRAHDRRTASRFYSWEVRDRLDFGPLGVSPSCRTLAPQGSQRQPRSRRPSTFAPRIWGFALTGHAARFTSNVALTCVVLAFRMAKL